MSPIDLTKPGRVIHVGVILMGGTTEILDVAPIDIFGAMSTEFINQAPDEMLPPEKKAQALDFQYHWVSEAGPSVPSKLSSGISLVPTDSFDTCPPLDITLIGAHNLEYMPNKAELAYVRKAYDECTYFMTICGGVMVPAMAGILEGKAATGPRFMLEQLRQQFPGTEWKDKRWVRDEKLWTSGALLNGTDMMTNVMKETWGGGEEKLGAFFLKLGSWPDRDIDYKDGP